MSTDQEDMFVVPLYPASFTDSPAHGPVSAVRASSAQTLPEAAAAAVQPLQLSLSKPTHNPELAVTTSELPMGGTRAGLPKSKYREQTGTVLAEVCKVEGGSGNLETVLPSLPCQGWGAGNCWGCWEACTVLCQPVEVIGLPNFFRGWATETSNWGNFETLSIKDKIVAYWREEQDILAMGFCQKWVCSPRNPNLEGHTDLTCQNDWNRSSSPHL